MIKYLFFFLLITAANPGLDEIRAQYAKSIDEEEAADKLYADLKSVSTKEPLKLAYKGAVRAVMAKHATWPNTKLNCAEEGLDFLNQAVKAAPENTEVRYLRFSIERNIPDFLGFTKHQDADKKFIIEQLLGDQHGLDQKMFILVRDYMLKKAELDSETRSKLKNAKP